MPAFMYICGKYNRAICSDGFGREPTFERVVPNDDDALGRDVAAVVFDGAAADANVLHAAIDLVVALAVESAIGDHLVVA